MEAVFKRMDTAELETVFKMKPVASGTMMGTRVSVCIGVSSNSWHIYTHTGKVDLYYSHSKWTPPRVSYSFDEGKTWQAVTDMTASQKAGYAAPLWWTVCVRAAEFILKFTNGDGEVCVGSMGAAFTHIPNAHPVRSSVGRRGRQDVPSDEKRHVHHQGRQPGRTGYGRVWIMPPPLFVCIVCQEQNSVTYTSPSVKAQCPFILGRHKIMPYISKREVNAGSNPLTEAAQAVSLFDPKRSQNMSIMLARLPLTFAEIRTAIINMDTLRLDESMVKGFLDFVPTKDEVRVASVASNWLKEQMS